MNHAFPVLVTELAWPMQEQQTIFFDDSGKVMIKRSEPIIPEHERWAVMPVSAIPTDEHTAVTHKCRVCSTLKTNVPSLPVLRRFR